MKAISVKYIGPTNSRVSRLRVTDGDDKIYVSFPYELSRDEAFWFAASQLARKKGWSGEWACGWTSDECVFVPIHPKYNVYKIKAKEVTT